MKRGGQPKEVARAILWLLSDEASYVTGAIVECHGRKVSIESGVTSWESGVKIVLRVQDKWRNNRKEVWSKTVV
jgi:hypothetical protein